MKFLKLLNLNQITQDKLSDIKAVILNEGNNRYVKLHFSTNLNLTPEDVSHLLEKIYNVNNYPETKDVNLTLTRVKVDQLLGFLTAEEIYGYILEVVKNVLDKSINMSDFYVELLDDSTKLVVLKQQTFESLIKIVKDLSVILENFGIITKPIELSLEEINKEAWIEEKFSKKEKEYEQKIDKAEIRPGFKEIDPTGDVEKKNIYFDGKIVEVVVRSNVKTKRGLMDIHTYTIGKGVSAAVDATEWISSNEERKPLKNGSYVRIYGNWVYDRYRGGMKMELNDESSIQLLSKADIVESTVDNHPIKRSELHSHTRMSVMDGVGNASTLIDKARQFGFKAIAITDSDSIQSFPDAALHMKNNNIDDIKLLYGVELTVVNDIDNKIVFNPKDGELLDMEYIFFDLETTGISPLLDKPIEFGAVKYKNGNVIETKQIFMDPGMKLSKFTKELTGIKDSDLEGQPKISEVMKEIKEWIGDTTLVAHNAKFDLKFLDSFFRRYGLGEFKNTVIDTLGLARLLYPKLRNYQLGNVAWAEFITYSENIAHRADYDAQVLQKIFENMLHKIIDLGIRNVNQINDHSSDILNYLFPVNVTVLIKNQQGMKDLFKLITDIHTVSFNSKKKTPQIKLSELLTRRENFLFGSSYYGGVIFEETSYDSTDIDCLYRYFDYIEVVPPSTNLDLILKDTYTNDGLNIILKTIIQKADSLNIPVVAISDAKYASEEDKLARDVYVASSGIGGKRNRQFNYKNPRQKNPEKHLRTTEEMFGEFSKILGEEKAEQIVVKNPNAIADVIDQNITPLKEKLYTPKIEGAEEEFLQKIQKTTLKTYGATPAPEILERIEKEVKSITTHGFAIVYYLSSLAVNKSIEDGYLVGSRGSVGSSIAATLSGITDVNPLAAHYICPSCKYHKFVPTYSSGFDLPDKACPDCGTQMKGEGHNIPFETFLGFDGDKVPDIDLNFSRENQSSIHLYIKNLLGEDRVYRAGTISTVANRTAFGYIKNYLEINGLEETFTKPMIKYLATKVEGTKRTTGQHPGGLIVVPKELDIHDFTPVNFPGNDSKSDWKTTHFDFHTIHDNLIKLDLLGHLDPSTLRMLQNLTGIDPQTIKMNDKKVLSLFESNTALGIIDNHLEDELGIIGIPEVGTSFVRKLVEEAKPKTFADLIRLSGLSHGTDVWTGNARDLILKEGKTLKEVISTRDDILIYLLSKGIDNLVSFKIMESVRKGRGLTVGWEKIMKEHDVPEWYIKSCKKIKYMFPKAHATAYVMMAFRIAWYKINYPLEYYAAYFTKRDAEFDINTVSKGPEAIKKYRTEISKKGWSATSREKEISDTYEVVLEVLSRGIKIGDISIQKSQSNEWIVDEGILIPPFSILEGMGFSAADKLIEERIKQPFRSSEDFKRRSGINKTQIATLESLGRLSSFDTSNSGETTGQITLKL